MTSMYWSFVTGGNSLLALKDVEVPVVMVIKDVIVSATKKGQHETHTNKRCDAQLAISNSNQCWAVWWY